MEKIRIKVTNCFGITKIYEYELEESETKEQAYQMFANDIIEDWYDDNGGEPIMPTCELLED